jgi:hypothetical protein
VVSEIENRARLAPPETDARPTVETAVYQLIAQLLAGGTSLGLNLQCRNGYLDSSSGSCRRDEYFTRFPGARDRLARTQADDLLGEPAYRFWFLLADDEPLICLETTGSVWTRQGITIDLTRVTREGVSDPVAVALATALAGA